MTKSRHQSNRDSVVADISNEKLMALADDELDPTERARVEAIVAARPDLQTRLAAFTATGKVLAPQYRRPFDEPLPRHLVDLVMGGANQSMASSVPSSANIDPTGILSWLKPELQIELPRWSIAFAYSAVLLIGAAGGWYFSRASIGEVPSPFDGGRLVASGTFSRSLEQTPSGTKLLLDRERNGRSASDLRIRLTFKSIDSFCRHYEITQPGGGSSEGIACRRSDGRWELIAHASTDIGPASGDKTMPAASSGSGLLAATVGRMIEGDALSVEEEAALIARLWHR